MITFNNFPYAEAGVGGDIAIVGAPFDWGVTHSRTGQASAPHYIRRATAWHPAEFYDPDHKIKIGRGIVDAGDVVLPKSFDGGGNAIRSYIGETAFNTQRVITLGGDNSISRFCLQGLADYRDSGPPPVLISLDAHSDTWLPEGVHGYDHGSWVRDVVEEGLVSSPYIIGHRTFSPGEQDWAWVDDNGIKHVSMEQWTRGGWRRNLNRLIDSVKAHPAVYLAVDIDVADPGCAPGTGCPEPGGMSALALLQTVNRLCAETNVVAMDVTELLPSADPQLITQILACRIVAHGLSGMTRRLNTLGEWYG